MVGLGAVGVEGVRGAPDGGMEEVDAAIIDDAFD